MTTLQRGEEALLCRVKAVDWARLKFCFAATALCMLLAHGFAWFNLFPSHDATILFFDADVVMLQLGRWVQLPYYRFLRGKINMPWLTGMFSVLWVSLSVYLISSLLQLRKKSMAAVAALFGTAISVTLLNATYNDKADLFTCAMLLALLGACAVRRCRRPWLGVLLCGGCLCLSMGLYQGYIEFAIGLLLLCMLRDCLTTDLPWKDYLRQGITAIAGLLLGGVLYAVSMKAVLAYKHLELIDSSNGLQQMSRAGVADYLARLPGAYKQVFTTLLGYDVWNNRGMRLATAVCLLLGLACLVLALSVAGKRVTTIEGLAKGGVLHPLQQAVVDHHALQCGFCTPGFILTAVEILESGKEYTDDELRKLLSGHLCRCTGYENILRAVKKTMYKRLGKPMPEA